MDQFLAPNMISGGAIDPPNKKREIRGRVWTPLMYSSELLNSLDSAQSIYDTRCT